MYRQHSMWKKVLFSLQGKQHYFPQEQQDFQFETKHFRWWMWLPSVFGFWKKQSNIKTHEDQAHWAFQRVGREEEECMNPTTTSCLPRPFITQPAEGKGNWKVCSGNSADRRQTTCQESCSCFVGQLIFSSELYESLCLPAMISEQSCIYNWMAI